ncbi:vWA domain-containing protein [Nonomuraea bangladeshensis]|uniref:vWA domain-containing protein n=1 Tax=Nonomuraea bangladeshensis TaxID=404385 RepID=UPI0031D0D905
MSLDETDSPFASVQRPRPLPVLVLADVSGSMAEHGKINSLNRAMSTMIRALARERSPRAEITIGVITFGGTGTVLHQKPLPAASVKWTDMTATAGPSGTPMGAAFELAQAVLEDKELMSEQAHPATLVLISDGEPTSAWRAQLDALLGSPQSKRSARLAVAIGPEAGTPAYRVLESFVADGLYPVVRADEADRVLEIFNVLTRSMSMRVNSTRPDEVPVFDPDELADLD